MMNVKKPIAVLCHKKSDGMTYMLERLRDNCVEYSIPHGRFVDSNNQEYWLVTTEDGLKGMEISDFWIAPGFGNHPRGAAMVALAGTRKR